MLHFCPINQMDIKFGALRKKSAQYQKNPPNFSGSIDIPRATICSSENRYFLMAPSL